MNDPNQTVTMMQQGFSFLEKCRYREALEVGRQLKRLRHSSAFEILALAYLRLDKLPKAIEVLEDGVSKAGRVWILWELLGNCYSDAGRFAQAERAYQKALPLEHCNQHVVHLNRAIAFNRAGKHNEAKLALRRVRSSRLRRRVDACRIRIALSLGEIRSARQIALRLASCRHTAMEKYDGETESEILFSCALALKGNPRTVQRALHLAYRAVEWQCSNEAALALIRDIRGGQTADLVLFVLMLKGAWYAPVGKSKMPPGFIRTLKVAAANQGAAFNLAKPFFPRAVRNSLHLEEVNTFACPALAQEGVYFLSPYHCYPRRQRR